MAKGEMKILNEWTNIIYKIPSVTKVDNISILHINIIMYTMYFIFYVSPYVAWF